MKINKLLTCGLLVLSLLGLTSIASAGVIEDIKAAYPKIELNLKEKQNDVGAVEAIKQMTIYRPDTGMVKMDMKLADINGLKLVCFEFKYKGSSWLFLKNVSVGNGTEKITLSQQAEPDRDVIGSSVYEKLFIIATPDELEFMKNAKLVRVHSNKGYVDIKIDTTKKNHVPFFEAIDYAIKFLEEK